MMSSNNQIDFELELDLQNQASVSNVSTGSGANEENLAAYEKGLEYLVCTNENGNKVTYRICELIEKPQEPPNVSPSTERDTNETNAPEGAMSRDLAAMVERNFEISKVAGQTMYKCKICKKTFYRLWNCKNHIEYSHVGFTSWSKVFADSAVLNQTLNHIGKTCPTDKQLIKSLIQSTANSKKGHTKNAQRSPYVRCGKCHTVFHSKYKLKKHIDSSDDCYEYYHPLVPPDTTSKHTAVKRELRTRSNATQ